MTPSGRPSGRRGNGLHAVDWGALVDLDPRLAETLLERLAGAQVAAYVEPASAADTYARATLPGRPMDRLFVDPARADVARAVVAEEVRALLADDDGAHGLVLPVPRFAARRVLPPPPLPDLPRPPAAPPAATPAADPAAPEDEDEAFRRIVAGWDAPPTDPVPRWSVSEDTGRDAAPPPAAPPAAPHRSPAGEGLPAWLEPDALDPEDLEPDRSGDRGTYVPPPPPPAPRVQPRTLGALAAVVLGLVLVFVPELLGQVGSPGTILFGAACLGGGAGALVWWLRDAPGVDDGPDDGAIV